MNGVDWGLLETFLAAADQGSFTAAAERLLTSQPTVSRRIQTLEETLGVALFARHGRGLLLTDRGAELLGSVRAMADQVDGLVRRASGMRERPAGPVRVSVNEPLAVHIVLPALRELLADHAAVELELVVDNRASNLHRREADIAVRMFRPHQPDLIAKHVGGISVGLFASETYAARHGLPKMLSECPSHVLIGFDRDPSWPAQLAALGLSPDAFRFRTDSLLTQLAAVREGVGIGGTHVALGARFGLLPVMPELPLPVLDVWLVTHEELRSSVAVRTVFDALFAFLSDYVQASCVRTD